MSARESTRQELRDLAKLAGTMPKDRTAPPPAVASAPGPASFPSAPSRTALQRPPTPSSVSKLTVPPAVASIAPASWTLAPPAGRPRRGGRGAVLTSVVLGLVMAVAGGVTLGRVLARRSAVAAAGPGTPVVIVAAATHLPASPPAAANPVVQANPAAVSAPSPAPSPAPTTTSAPLAASLATSTAAAAVAPTWKAATRRSGWRPAPKSAAVARIPTSAPPAPGGKDSLDEAIRKAVASP